jgi:hypothetical protein
LAAYGFALANGVLLITSRSDWLTLVSGQGNRLYCGNFGFVSVGEPAQAQDPISPGSTLVYHHGPGTRSPGEQAGAVWCSPGLLGYTCFVGHKLVKAKRGNSTQSLATTFDRVRTDGNRDTGPCPKLWWGPGTRFGTSGPPSVLETHWHEWSPARIERVVVPGSGALAILAEGREPPHHPQRRL